MAVSRASAWLWFGLAFALSACSGDGSGGKGSSTDNVKGNNTGGSNGEATGDNGQNGGSNGDANGGSDNGNSGSMVSCKTTCEADECGFVSDGCGGTVECLGIDMCPEGMGCGLDPMKPSRCAYAPSSCTRKTADQVCADKCGYVSDGCDGVIECTGKNGGITCASSQSCGGLGAPSDKNECIENPSCKPVTCEQRKLQCGVVGDGCGGMLNCNDELGPCPSGTVCGTGASANKCVAPPTCNPLTPAQACANTCGITGDGCGGQINCESFAATKCPVGTTCGGGGVANQCGSGSANSCTKLDAATQCAGRCGFASDGCGGSYDCASFGGQVCNPNQGESCGGGGVPNQCGKPACTPKTAQQACPGAGSFKSCGPVADGCGGTVDCGGCLQDQLCGISQNGICGPIPQCVPTPIATACAGKCGVIANGCGGTYNCAGVAGAASCVGSEFCGANEPNKCGVPPSTCTPKTCADLGHQCGLASDGCGNRINCWAGCAENNLSCTGACGAAEACIADPSTSAQACVTGSGGCVGPLCGSVPNCSPNSLTTLTGTVVTPGVVLSSGGTPVNRVPIPNATVYIPADPNAALPAIFQGVDANSPASCGRCEDEQLVAEGQAVLASAVTDYKGEFRLTGRIPVGVAFKLVIKAGKWRRVVEIPAGQASRCATRQLSRDYTRLPKNQTDGLTGTNIPRIAFSTGYADGMECVFRRMGISDSEFTLPSRNGRFHVYRGNGARLSSVCENKPENGTCLGMYNCRGPGDCSDCQDFENRQDLCTQPGCTWTPRTVECSGNNNAACINRQPGCQWAAAPEAELLGDEATLHSYDMIVMDCEGFHHDEEPDQRARVVNYVDHGGRMFASHYSYAWIEGNDSLDLSADWGVDGDQGGDTGYISMPPPSTTPRVGANPSKSPLFRNWLDWQGALDNDQPGRLDNPPLPSFHIDSPRDRAGENVGPWTDEWMYRLDDQNTSRALVQQLSFNTPYGASEHQICGRVAYSGFHVTGAAGRYALDSFPAVCPLDELSAQEKVLLFMLFDLAACVSTGEPPTPPSCVAKTAQDVCPNVNDACGYLPDGCGGVVDCGGCDGGFYCDGNACTAQECTPSTCASLGFNCGNHADGCGGIARNAQGQQGCGVCTDGQVCGLGGQGICGSPTCVQIPRATACPANSCGLVSDGCGGTYDCGTCASGQVCGGGGANQCGPGACTPIPLNTACAQKNCGYVSDGCGGTHKCGDCTLPDTCGGGGTPNVCGHPSCTPYTRDQACMGLDCGFVSDGCGGAIDCGMCPDGRICGGNGPNKCGDACVETSCQAEMAECGAIGNDCGGIIDCGPCKVPGQVCGAAGANKCGGGVCKPVECKDVGAECGLIGDGCGRVKDCGECTVPGETCGGAGVPNQCDPGKGGCKKLSCRDQAVQCGAAGDGCGGLLDCGGCDPGYVCEKGMCVEVVVVQ